VQEGAYADESYAKSGHRSAEEHRKNRKNRGRPSAEVRVVLRGSCLKRESRGNACQGQNLLASDGGVLTPIVRVVEKRDGAKEQEGAEGGYTVLRVVAEHYNYGGNSSKSNNRGERH